MYWIKNTILSDKGFLITDAHSTGYMVGGKTQDTPRKKTLVKKVDKNAIIIKNRSSTLEMFPISWKP